MASEALSYCNGEYLPAAGVSIPLHDAGFVYGATVSDLLRTFQQRLYRLEDHISRFCCSAEQACIPLRHSAGELADICRRVVEHNAHLLPATEEQIAVLLATPGRAMAGPAAQASQDAAPTLIVYSYPLPWERYAPLLRGGAVLETSPIQAPGRQCLPPEIKHRSRLHWWLAQQRASAGTLAVLCDADGFITETSTANVLVVRHGCVFSPRQEAILKGVSRDVVRELCQALEVPFLEADLRPEDCYGASEIWLSSTPYCLAPVASWDGHRFPCPGTLYSRVVQRWSQEVGVDIVGQFLGARTTCGGGAV
jgi:branched-subunit amino acid aminotransferase/4-amino-4-deoxychorismate lyase